jgi:hypothetical protein
MNHPFSARPSLYEDPADSHETVAGPSVTNGKGPAKKRKPNPQRFPFILTFAVPASIQEALDRATQDDLLTKSDYCRLALKRILIADGYYIQPNKET